jgi:hypothetical protein
MKTVTRRRTVLGAVGLLALGPVPAGAHNNPNFKEVLLATFEVSAEPDAAGRHSAPVTIAEWPAKTIEYIWRVEGAEGVSFAVSQGGERVAEGLGDGARSARIKGDDIAIVEVGGAGAGFVVKVYANVIDRSSAAG